MNSSRLRSAIEAPKLAITMMMAVPLRPQPREEQAVEGERQEAGQAMAAISPATSTGQPKENGPSGAIVAAEGEADEPDDRRACT